MYKIRIFGNRNSNAWGGDRWFYADDIRIRKYASPEPSISFASYNLTGRVLNSSSGLGISGALVKLNTYPQYNATTNITGDYSMSVPAGMYDMSASAVGYAQNTMILTINADIVQDFALSTLPTVRYINGTVMDSITKELLVGVTVSTTEASTTSNESGFYSLPVASGTYPITATYDIRYYSNNSVTVSTELSAVVVQDIELVKKSTGNITGSVTKI
ncbi:MAG: carboxypeptidase regulatory-like domain-containing protein [Candidatus Methanoperedens sp.]